MPTAADNLQTALDNATARLAEMDAVPLDERARMTYQVGDESFGWNEYRAALVAQIKDTADMVASAKRAAVAGKPYVVRSRHRG